MDAPGSLRAWERQQHCRGCPERPCLPSCTLKPPAPPLRPSQYLSLFSHKIREQTRLTPQEIQAIAAYVASAIPEFKHFKGSEALIKVSWAIPCGCCC